MYENRNKLCTYKFIAREYKGRIISQPDIKLWKLHELVREQFGLKISKSVCGRARRSVMKEFRGDWNVEFSRLTDYVDMIKKIDIYLY